MLILNIDIGENTITKMYAGTVRDILFLCLDGIKSKWTSKQKQFTKPMQDHNVEACCTGNHTSLNVLLFMIILPQDMQVLSQNTILSSEIKRGSC